MKLTKFHFKLHSKYGPYDYSSYNGRLHEVGRIPVTLKKHHLYGKQNLHDQNNTPNMPQQPNASNVVIPPQSNIKYELEPYPGHHPLANGLDSGASNFQIQVSSSIATNALTILIMHFLELIESIKLLLRSP